GGPLVCLRFALRAADLHLVSFCSLILVTPFPPHGIAHIVNQRAETLIAEGEEGGIKRILSSILCHLVFDIFELFYLNLNAN
ncbi:unnamed protein product, partial [Musa acuminata var. zebrina]